MTFYVDFMALKAITDFKNGESFHSEISLFRAGYKTLNNELVCAYTDTPIPNNVQFELSAKLVEKSFDNFGKEQAIAFNKGIVQIDTERAPIFALDAIEVSFHWVSYADAYSTKGVAFDNPHIAFKQIMQRIISLLSDETERTVVFSGWTLKHFKIYSRLLRKYNISFSTIENDVGSNVFILDRKELLKKTKDAFS